MVCPFQLIEDQNTSKTLAFSCDLCSCNEAAKGDISKSPYCLQQFLQILPFIDGEYPCQFFTNEQIVFLPRASMEILKEYAMIVAKHESRVHPILRQYPEIKQALFSNPIAAYLLLVNKFKTSKNRLIHKFISALKETQLLSQAETALDNTSLDDQQAYFQSCLQIQKKRSGYSQSELFAKPFQLCSSYEIGPFQIRIFESSHLPLERFYQAIVSLDEIHSPGLLQNLFSQHGSSLEEEMQLQTLEALLTHTTSRFQHLLRTNFKELSKIERENLAIYATAQALNLTKTMPLLLDDEVQEIYLDRPRTAYYLDHAKWGRCKSNLEPRASELAHIITRLRLESRKPLDEQNPSLKTELKTKLFHVRAAIDIPPLAYEGPHLNIRKIRLRALTLPELITNGTLSLSAAAFLILCLTLRINITVSGEPSTGKTTLANALNLLAPPSWRKIAIEDALESISIDEGDRHKVTFRVDPFDSFENGQSTKSNEIIRLLHRSPDWVFLGEIQTAEHSAAMFHAISAGIRGIQTCHANSNEELLLRWQIHHDIPEVCFQSLGLLVHMVRNVIQGKIIRKVAQISEVQYESDKALLNPIFEWCKSSGKLEQRIADLHPKIISQTCRFQELSKSTINDRLLVYQETLRRLVSNQIFDPKQIVTAFDQVYAGMNSTPTKLEKHPKNERGGAQIELCHYPS